MMTEPNPQGSGWFPEWFPGMCERHGIDPSTVIRDSIDAEHQFVRMWRSTMGTYEAVTPHDRNDQMVAIRTISTVTLRVVGTHPGGRIEFAAGNGPDTTRITLTDETPWEWLTDTPRRTARRKT